MKKWDSEYSDFVIGIRAHLLGVNEPLSEDAFSYVVVTSWAQIEKLPPQFYFIFRLLLKFATFLLKLTPKSLQYFLFKMFEFIPGFSTLIVYQKKIGAAAEMEFFFQKSEIKN